MLVSHFCLRPASRRTVLQAHGYHIITQPKAENLNACLHQGDLARFSKLQNERQGTPGALQGKLIAVKDNIVTKNFETTAASKILEGYISPFDATVVKLLGEHGAVISAKTNLDEFGMGSHSQYAVTGPVRSPFSRKGRALSPGGSSGGSAVAVATAQCWAALGTDTGGSVRLPAAYTGTVGFKPSYGLLSRWGVIQYANSLDTVGMVAQSVDDAERIFDVLNVYDAYDPTSLSESIRARIGASRSPMHPKSLRIGVPIEYNIEELSPIIRNAYARMLNQLQEIGHTIYPVSLPSTRQALSAYYVLAPAEASSNLAKYDGIRYGFRLSRPDSSSKDNLPLYASTRGEGFGEEVKRRILLGAYSLSSEAIDNYFIQAQKVRRLVQRDFNLVFAQPNPLLDRELTGNGEVDLLITPTAPTLPPTIYEVERKSPIESYMNDVFTVPASLAGLPAISIPLPLSAEERSEMDDADVRSVGMQLIGQFGDDRLVLRAAKDIEKSQGYAATCSR